MADGPDEMVAVASASGEVEAGMMQGLLENAGIPSVQQRMGVNGPMFGIPLLNPGGGERRILVQAHRAEEARDVIEAFT